MSLNKSISLTVNDYDIKLSSNIKFYQNDQLKLKFEINEYGINVENGVKVRASMPVTPLSAILFIETPLGVDSIESTVIENNTVTFYLSSTHTQHVGISRMQIQLSDEDGCQVTLPPFQFEIRENIYDGEVVLNQVLLADEDNNILVDENGNGLNIGTQVSSQTYAVALSADETKTATSSIPTKQIQDYDLKIGVKGTEDLLIQDNGITKRMKTSELMDAVTIDVSIYYTKEEINTLLENKADVSHTHVVADITDLSIPIIDVDKAYVDTQLETKANVTDIPNLTGYALKTEIPTVPTKVSELTNDSGYITTIPTEYITETELNTVLSTKANISDIPSLEGYATEVFVTNKIAEASLGGGDEVDLSGYATKDDLSTKADVSHSHTADGINGLSTVAISGSYNDLIGKPTIPTVDVNKNYVDTQLATKANVSDIPNLDDYALKTEIPTVPTKTSELANDVGFITTIPKEYITETELDAKGYLTEHIDISGKANISDLATVATSGDYNDLLNKPTVTNGVDGKSAYEIYVENTTETPLTETEWLSSLKGADGEQGIQGENGATFMPSVDSLGNLSWTNDKGLTNPNTINIKGEKGDKGDKGATGAIGSKGADGSKWYNGYHCTGTSTSGTVFPNTGISNARVYDMYINTKSGSADLGNIYVCSASGDASVAQWKYSGNIRGTQGLQGVAGAKGDKGDKGDKGEDYTEVLVTSNSSGGKVTLTADKYQYTSLSNGDTITLPSVSKFTQIHLFFETKTELTLTLPPVKWQKTPDIQALKTYEFIFTYVNGTWLGGWVVYE